MKLASFTEGHESRVGAMTEDGSLVDVAEIVAAAEGNTQDPLFTDMIRLIEGGESARERVKRALDRTNADPSGVRRIAIDRVTWLSPVLRPSKICCIALNNSANSDRIIAGPNHPALFIKASNALVGSGGAIRLRRQYGRVHPEPELGVIIGKTLHEIDPADAYDYVYGYTIHNDITSPTMRGEDTFHYRAIHPAASGEADIAYVDTFATYPGRYKCSDTFSPLGPWLVTRDEIVDAHELAVVLRRGDQVITEDNTKNLTHKIPEALAFISQYITLLPGDVVSMGTAIKRTNQNTVAVQNVDLQKTDQPISISIDGLGTLVSRVERI